MHYWLMRSEPDVFSIQDLQQAKGQRTCWDGVRNYQARNFLRDQILVGHRILFYHSRCKPLAIVGTVRVSRAGYPDPTQFDPNSKYYDPKSSPQHPRWFAVDIVHEQTFPVPVEREKLLDDGHFADMLLLQPGSRLSVQPVAAAHFHRILTLGQAAHR